jgi:hypothetical protein
MTSRDVERGSSDSDDSTGDLVEGGSSDSADFTKDVSAAKFAIAGALVGAIATFAASLVGGYFQETGALRAERRAIYAKHLAVTSDIFVLLKYARTKTGTVRLTVQERKELLRLESELNRSQSLVYLVGSGRVQDANTDLSDAIGDTIRPLLDELGPAEALTEGDDDTWREFLLAARADINSD